MGNFIKAAIFPLIITAFLAGCGGGGGEAVTINMTGDWLVSYAADQCQTYSHEGIARFYRAAGDSTQIGYPSQIVLNSYRCPPNVTASFAYWTLTRNHPAEMTRLELTEMLRDILNMNTVTVVMFAEDFISWHIDYFSDCSGPNNLDCGIFELTRNP